MSTDWANTTIQRIFSYANHWDFVAYGVGVITAAGAGVTMPLMIIVFGEFVGNMSNFMTDNASRDAFRNDLQRLS